MVVGSREASRAAGNRVRVGRLEVRLRDSRVGSSLLLVRGRELGNREEIERILGWRRL